MTRAQRIALAVWRRRKPLAHMFPWAQHPDGTREVFSREWPFPPDTTNPFALGDMLKHIARSIPCS